MTRVGVRTISGYPPLTYNFTSLDMSTEKCTDFTGSPWTDTTFDLRRGVCPRVTLNGARTQSGILYTSTDVPLGNTPMSCLRDPFLRMEFARTPIPSGTLAAMAVANANPNRPDIDLPVSIAELRELPSLLKDVTGLLAGKLTPARAPAKANLAVQFGVLPLVSDIGKLFKFAQLVNARETYLRELSRGKKRLRRNLTKESWTGVTSPLVAFNSTSDNTGTTKCIVTGKMNRTYWYTMSAGLLDIPTEREIKSLAPELVLGVHSITAEMLWNLVPWTWLIDWFSDTGTLLGAYRGGLRWRYSRLNVMYQTEYDMVAKFTTVRNGFTVTPTQPQGRAVTKVRIQPTVSIFPTWRIPYLTGRQLSILSSLAILRI